MKWKQIRGKFYPQLSYLVKVNTPRAVMAETKKAFRKLPNLEQAMAALSNLKGVGTTMASGKNFFLNQKYMPVFILPTFSTQMPNNMSHNLPEISNKLYLIYEHTYWHCVPLSVSPQHELLHYVYKLAQ